MAGQVDAGRGAGAGGDFWSQRPTGGQMVGGLLGGLVGGVPGMVLGARMGGGDFRNPFAGMFGGGTTGPGMLSNQGPAWVPPANPAAGWRGGYLAPGADGTVDGTQHGPPATVPQAGAGVRTPRTEGAIYDFGQMRGPNGSPIGQAGGVNRMLRGDTINNGRLLGMGVIPWRQSGIAFGTQPEVF